MPDETDPPTDAPINVSCSRCGQPVVVTDDLKKALDAIPAGAALRLLCPACSTSESADTPPAQTRAERVFRVSILLQELAEEREVKGGQDDGGIEEVWEDIGGFQLRGSGDSVRQFVEYQSTEFGRRMEMILAMADTPVASPTSTPNETPPQLDVPPDGPTSV